MRLRRILRLSTLALLVYAALLALLLIVESGHEEANITSLPAAIWYSLVTLTTVGYGDFYPVTAVGRGIGLFFLLGSLGVLGLLIGEIGEKMHEYREKKRLGHHGTQFTDHIIIIGWDDFSRTVARQLLNADRQVAVVSDRKDDVDAIYDSFGRQDIFVLYADLRNTEMLEQVNIRKSRMTFVNLPQDTDKLITILNIKKMYGDRNFLVTLENSELEDTFHSAGVTYVVSRRQIAAKLTASYIFEPDVARFAGDLLASTKDEMEYDLQQFRVTSDNPYLNKSYGEVFRDLKQEHNVVLVGMCKENGRNRELLKLPPDDTPVESGDYLIMIVNGRTERIIADKFGVREGVD